jgi:hypothetical protein
MSHTKSRYSNITVVQRVTPALRVAIKANAVHGYRTVSRIRSIRNRLDLRNRKDPWFRISPADSSLAHARKAAQIKPAPILPRDFQRRL